MSADAGTASPASPPGPSSAAPLPVADLSRGEAQAYRADVAADATTEQDATIGPLIAIHGGFHSTAVCVTALLLFFFALHLAAAFFIPLLLSLFLSYALGPFVTRLAKWKIPRAIGAAVAVALVVALIGGAFYRVGDDFGAILEQLPASAQRLRLAITESRTQHPGAIAQVERAATELQKLADAASPTAAPAARVAPAPPPAQSVDVRSLLMVGSGGVVVALGQFSSALFLTYFLLSAGPLFRRKLLVLTGESLSARKTAIGILDEIDHLNQHYFAVVLVINIAVGVCTGLALYALGMEHPVVWGVAAGVLHTIPYLGSAVVSAAAGLIAYGKFGTITATLLAAGLPLFIASALGVGLQTWLMGRAARMNATVVFVSLLFWSMVWGAWGLLLAVPIMVAIKTVCDRVDRLKPIGAMLAP